MTTTDDPMIARSTDPASSHDRMVLFRRRYKSRSERVMGVIDCHYGTPEWYSTKEITRMINERSGSDLQERDVSRLMTTMWRERRVARRLLPPNDGSPARRVLHFRAPHDGEDILDRTAGWFNPEPEGETRPPLPDLAPLPQETLVKAAARERVNKFLNVRATRVLPPAVSTVWEGNDRFDLNVSDIETLLS